MSTPAGSPTTATPRSSRSKYANDEERKAAARERQRIYAAKKRAEAKEAKLREQEATSQSTTSNGAYGGDSFATSTSSVSPPMASQAVFAPQFTAIQPAFVAPPAPGPGAAMAPVTPAKKGRTPKKKPVEQLLDEVIAPAPTMAPAPIVADTNGFSKATGIAPVAAPTPKKRGPKKKEVKSEDTITFMPINGKAFTPQPRAIEEPSFDAPGPALSFAEDHTLNSFLPPSQLLTDYMLISPPPSPHYQLFPSSPPPTEYLIMHTPGNPGLISYYKHYLPLLSTLLSTSPNLPTSTFTILGQSLAGFDTTPNKPTKEEVYQVYTLTDQIHRRVELLHHILTTNPSLKIILTGHSVGAYILLESLRLLRLHHPSLVRGRIIGGICLFPTITHISRSSSGRKVTPLLKVPGLLKILVFIANLIIALTPIFILNFWLKIFMRRLTPDARQSTIDFLKSPNGIRQSILMGKDEMLGIGEDEWDDGIWGALGQPAETELVFYFGKGDHWVNDRERDRVIKKRGRGGVPFVEDVVGGEVEVKVLRVEGEEQDGWKPRMMVCEEGVGHSYCVAHSDVMAAKTARWVEEMVLDDKRKYGLL